MIIFFFIFSFQSDTAPSERDGWRKKERERKWNWARAKRTFYSNKCSKWFSRDNSFAYKSLPTTYVHYTHFAMTIFYCEPKKWQSEKERDRASNIQWIQWVKKNAKWRNDPTPTVESVRVRAKRMKETQIEAWMKEQKPVRINTSIL